MNMRDRAIARGEELELLCDKYCDIISRVQQRQMQLSLEQRMLHTRVLLVKFLEEASLLPRVEPPLDLD